MIRKLKEILRELYHFDSGKKIPGKNKGMRGNCTDLNGDCTKLSGDCSGLWGDCTKLSGDCSGIFGDCSDLSGNLDYCEVTDEERKKGVHIYDLIQEG